MLRIKRNPQDFHQIFTLHSPLFTLPSHRQLPYSLPRPVLQQGGFGGHGRGGRGRQHWTGSRFTHTTRFPQASTPSSTSATSPGRQGFSIVTRRQWHSSGNRPGPRPPSPNTGTRTQASESRSPGSAGYSGMPLYIILTTPFQWYRPCRSIITMPLESVAFRLNRAALCDRMFAHWGDIS